MMKRNPESRLVEFIVRWPRFVRILVAAVFALAVTLALSPLIDLIYDHFFFSMETRVVPSLVSSGFGLLMYLLGWWLMVGTIGEKPAARTALRWYIGTGIVALIVVGILIVRGFSLVSLVTSS